MFPDVPRLSVATRICEEKYEDADTDTFRPAMITLSLLFEPRYPRNRYDMPLFVELYVLPVGRLDAG